MTEWTYYTPEKDGEPHPDYREGMEWQCRIATVPTWAISSLEPGWSVGITYRFRPLAQEAAKAAPFWIKDRARALLRRPNDANSLALLLADVLRSRFEGVK